MTAHAIAALLAADHALPHRDRLLDATAVTERLAQLVGRRGEIERCRLRRAKYRVGESLRVVYDVDVDGARHQLAGRMSLHGRSESIYRSAIDRAVPSGPFDGVFHDDRCSTVWWTFPNDRKLRHLDALMRPPSALGLTTAPSWTHSELVEFAPEQCATVRCLDNTERTVAFAKAYRPGDGRHLAERYRLIAESLAIGGVTRTPQPLSWSSELDVLVLETLPGRRWAELNAAELSPLFAKLGPAIAAVHQIQAVSAREFGRLSTQRVVHSAELVATARPDLADLCAALSRELRDGPPDSPADRVLLHGDVHPGNALLDGSSVHLIDLDQSAIGAAAADIGSLAARMRYLDVLAADGSTHGAELFAMFADGYASLRPLPSSATLRWHTAAALVAERAMRAVNRVHRDALPMLEPVLVEALALLQKDNHDDL